MAGVPISAFLDWQVNTGPQFLSGAKNIINSISRRSWVIGKFLRGKPMSQILQGSDKIQEVLYLNANRTSQEFERGEDVSWQNPQKDKLMALDYKFFLDHMAWDEWEYLGQTSGLTGDGLRTKYKDMASSKQQRLWESIIDGLEDLMWVPPATNTSETTTFAAMESGGKQRYSIPVFINEGVGSTTGAFSNAWTTIEGLTWSDVSTNFDNKRVQYDATDPADTDDNDNGLFNAFDEISIDIKYKPPGFHDEAFEAGVRVPSDWCICTSKKGMTQVMSMHRKSNDMLIQPQDASYPYPRWNGTEILDVQGLDTAALYASSSAAFVTEEAATVTNSGARYYFMNTKYLKAIFHRAKYFKMGKVKEPERKVGQYIIPVEVWGNLTCTSRRHQGIVYPGG